MARPSTPNPGARTPRSAGEALKPAAGEAAREAARAGFRRPVARDPAATAARGEHISRPGGPSSRADVPLSRPGESSSNYGDPLPRPVGVRRIGDVVARLLIEANYAIGDDILDALRRAADDEQSPLGRDVLRQLVDNYETAKRERLPACQDTGLTIVYLGIGQDVHLVGGDLYEAVNDGIRRGTREGFLRHSVVGDPLLRENTGDNAPGIVHVDIIPGNQVHVTVACKGFGSENKSRLAMLTPADGIEGVKNFIIETVDLAGAQACPPFVVGVGIGGSFDMAAHLAKRALLRPVNVRHAREDLAALEEELLESVNRLGIGPQGMGGIKTALGVNVEVYPTHIAGLPVAVNIGCHSNRHKEAWV